LIVCRSQLKGRILAMKRRLDFNAIWRGLDEAAGRRDKLVAIFGLK